MYYEKITAEPDHPGSMRLDNVKQSFMLQLPWLGERVMGLEAVLRLVTGEHTFHLTWAVEGEISLTPGALSFAAADVSIQHCFTLQQETGERHLRG